MRVSKGVHEEKTRPVGSRTYGQVRKQVKHNLSCLNWKLRLQVSLARMSINEQVREYVGREENGSSTLSVKAFVWGYPSPLSRRQLFIISCAFSCHPGSE